MCSPPRWAGEGHAWTPVGTWAHRPERDAVLQGKTLAVGPEQVFVAGSPDCGLRMQGLGQSSKSRGLGTHTQAPSKRHRREEAPSPSAVRAPRSVCPGRSLLSSQEGKLRAHPVCGPGDVVGVSI